MRRRRGGLLRISCCCEVALRFPPRCPACAPPAYARGWRGSHRSAAGLGCVCVRWCVHCSCRFVRARKGRAACSWAGAPVGGVGHGHRAADRKVFKGESVMGQLTTLSHRWGGLAPAQHLGLPRRLWASFLVKKGCPNTQFEGRNTQCSRCLRSRPPEEFVASIQNGGLLATPGSRAMAEPEGTSRASPPGRDFHKKLRRKKSPAQKPVSSALWGTLFVRHRSSRSRGPLRSRDAGAHFAKNKPFALRSDLKNWVCRGRSPGPPAPCPAGGPPGQALCWLPTS